MTKEEQIKQKAEAEADKVIIGSGMDRASVIHLKHLLTTFYIIGIILILFQGYHAGAIEATKELEAQIEELKEKLEITDLALDNCLKDSEVEK